MSENIPVLPSSDDDVAEEEVDFAPFFDYLKSENGHQIASRVLGIVEDVKKATIDKNSKHAVFETSLQIVIIVVVVAASSILAYLGKFESSTGVLFGTLVGYFFGKR